jgi:hypothetical protein
MRGFRRCDPYLGRPGLTEVTCEAHAQAADELGPGAGWQGYSLRAKGNQNIEIAEAIAALEQEGDQLVIRAPTSKSPFARLFAESASELIYHFLA